MNVEEVEMIDKLEAEIGIKAWIYYIPAINMDFYLELMAIKKSYMFDKSLSHIVPNAR